MNHGRVQRVKSRNHVGLPKQHAHFNLGKAPGFANHLGMSQNWAHGVRHDSGAMANQEKRIAFEQGGLLFKGILRQTRA